MKTEFKNDGRGPILLWDLHEVVFCKSWKQLLQVILRCDGKKNVLATLPKNVMSLYKKRFTDKNRKNISIADLIYIAQGENNKQLMDFVFNICCAYKPMLRTVAIIRALKEQGFVNHVGSNIARPVLDQFKEQYQEIFSLFEYAHVVDVVSYDQVIQKPDPLFFKSYLEIVKVQPSEVIFIDNKKKNINTAKNLGFQTVHFKRASQLKKELRRFFSI